MTDIYRMKIVAVAVAAASFTACEAFAPQQQPTSIRATSQDSLVSRDALFGLFGATDEKTVETSAETTTANNGAMDVFSSLKGKALIEKTKDIVDNKSGFYSPADPDVFAEDFVFRGPFVGPLNKKDYVGTMEAFSIYESFPDISANSWGYSIDPKDPNRVWFMCRNTGTFNGKPMLPDLVNVKPNDAKLEGPPETFSVVYDDDQKLKYLSVGYVADRFDGNTQGLGAAFGIFKIIGLYVPGPSPALRFLQWFNSETMDSYPRSYSTDVPEWFLKEKGADKAVQGY
mmetsp:Transcript_21935/g.45085  ORF Transcript_21935/g.45085 Transcript_21935/m.45085 type:complete len:286 (-) Transcript_21935:45-902(-)|eukprot:CAMPEP_0197275680 /NCGR_PEP_ID=MMETSP1432-20130617/14219_1 /TAXON_ID=44447 /ORGANISM="Pseudo-nitzschia delicatissima, Strain UNC1205" /LENGTH=285 /DNA_ID=CAMNT_0042741605 /DNA_START=18 /DNA_END=875 /DNA_ORIENTATION=+